MNSVSPITAYSQKVNFKNVTKPNFKADTENTIEVKQEKGFSKEAKIVTGVIGALALAGGITYAIMRKPSEGKKAVDKAKAELSKDWKEAMEFFNIKQLPEHIDFKEAKTLEEALQYGKTFLNIEYKAGKYGWNVDAVNFINRSIVDVSNAMKGKSYLPKEATPWLVVSNPEEAAAAIRKNGKTLDVNGLMFIRNGLDKDLKTIFKWLQKPDELAEYFDIKAEAEFKKLLEKYTTGNLTYIEKWQFYCTFSEGIHSPLKNPMNVLKFLSKKYPELKLNIKELSSKTIEEQKLEMKKIIKKLKDEGKSITLVVDKCALPYEITYHELGHNQHCVSDYIVMGINDRKAFENKHHDFSLKKGDWDAMHNNGQIQIWHEPILEFFESKNQTIAREVSNYAATNPAEFIAETFARKMQGYKFSDKVEALYKKYNGPEILNPPPVKEPIWHFE